MLVPERSGLSSVDSVLDMLCREVREMTPEVVTTIKPERSGRSQGAVGVIGNVTFHVIKEAKTVRRFSYSRDKV